MPKIGEQLHMYSGLRTKNCVLISKDETLQSIQRIFMKFSYEGSNLSRFPKLKICIDGKQIYHSQAEQLARYDGFKDFLEFYLYWLPAKYKVELPCLDKTIISAFILHWTDLKY
jgi:hypothetical protein